MKILVVGDPHLKVASYNLAVRFIDWLHDEISELQPDIVVNLGDTFHTHNVIRSEIMSLIDGHLKWMHVNFASKKLYPAAYFILVGNHDMAHHKTPDVHAWLPYKGRYDKIWIIDKPHLAGRDLAFLPYIDDPAEFQKELDKAMDSNGRTIFCHQTFRGADFGFIKTKEGAQVPANFGGQIISGHIHKNQKLGCVWYPGTPFAQEAGDHNEIKGIFLYDTETRTAEFLQSPLPQWVTSHATPANFVEVIGRMIKSDRNHLVLEGPGAEVSAAADSKVFKDLKKEYGFSVKKNSTSSVKSSNNLKKVSTVEDAVVEYIDRIYDGTVDKAQLKTKCLSALQ